MSTKPIRDPEIRAAYATDASGLYLEPAAITRPTSTDEIVEILREAHHTNTPVTVAGGQTSTTAASITNVGTLMSLRALDQILDIDTTAHTVRVQPGVLVGDLKRAVAREGLLFAPDPTSEDDCTIGGAIACNASGARTYKYGATRAHVRSLRVALTTGAVLDLRRNQLEKNTVGYSIVHDPIDWFIGSEGTLGVIVQAELALLPLPVRVIGIAVPFVSESDALAFIIAARETITLTPRCLEYFDALAFEIARSVDDQSTWARDASTMVYLEQEISAESSTSLDTMLTGWLALAESHHAHPDLRVFDSDAAIRHARAMRHAVPATMNERGAHYRAHGGRKVSTDWAVPYRRLQEAITLARQLADDHGIPQAVIYGHAGNGHPHQNFIARDAEELKAITAVIDATLRHVIAMGGTVSAEHGIGKLKRQWLPLQLTPIQLGMMRAMKRELDPYNLLAPGNIL